MNIWDLPAVTEQFVGRCIRWVTSGNAIATCWNPTHNGRKKRRLRRQIRHLPPRSVLLAEDETDLLLLPPLRAGWARRGEPAVVQISGRNGRRVIFGTLNLRTGHRIFLARCRQRAVDFQAFLKMLHQHYRGWHVVLLLDEDSAHTAGASQQLAEQLQIRLLWLPKRCPHLNPLERLWKDGKEVISANRQRSDLDQQAERFLQYLRRISNKQALKTSGIASEDFWLKNALSKNF